MWSVTDEIAVGRVNILDKDFFKLAHNLWTQVMTRIAADINSMGGQAQFDPDATISKRINYVNQVRSADRQKISASGN